jgi:hypothetical protein
MVVNGDKFLGKDATATADYIDALPATGETPLRVMLLQVTTLETAAVVVSGLAYRR